MSADRELYADARAENACFEAGHPLEGDRCACGLVARAIRHRVCGNCHGRIYPTDATIGDWLHAECRNPPRDAT